MSKSFYLWDSNHGIKAFSYKDKSFTKEMKLLDLKTVFEVSRFKLLLIDVKNAQLPIRQLVVPRPYSAKRCVCYFHFIRLSHS